MSRLWLWFFKLFWVSIKSCVGSKVPNRVYINWYQSFISKIKFFVLYLIFSSSNCSCVFLFNLRPILLSQHHKNQPRTFNKCLAQCTSTFFFFWGGSCNSCAVIFPKNLNCIYITHRYTTSFRFDHVFKMLTTFKKCFLEILVGGGGFILLIFPSSILFWVLFSTCSVGSCRFDHYKGWIFFIEFSKFIGDLDKESI